MIWSLSFSAVAFFICLPLYFHYRKSRHLSLAAAYKCLGAACAVLPACIASIRLDPRCWICVFALLFYCAGCITVDYHIFWGAGLFLLGSLSAVVFCLSFVPVSFLHLASLVIFGSVLKH